MLSYKRCCRHAQDCTTRKYHLKRQTYSMIFLERGVSGLARSLSVPGDQHDNSLARTFETAVKARHFYIRHLKHVENSCL